MKKNNRMFWARSCCWALVVFMALFIGQRLYFTMTAGFRLSRIHSNFSYNPKWDVRKMSPEEERTARAALDQKYYYLGRGCQAYAFVSEDGQFVLKFCKQHHLRVPWFLEDVKLPFGLEEWRLNQLRKKKAKRDLIFYGFKLGYEKIPEESGVIYSHINRSDSFLGALTLVDKLGFEHSICLDEIVFLLQKTTYPIKPTLESYMSQGDLEGAKQVIDAIFAVYVERSKKGIIDRDRAMINNLGWKAGKAYVIDLGSIDEDESIKDPSVYKRDIKKRSKHFCIWLKAEYPALYQYFKKRTVEL